MTQPLKPPTLTVVDSIDEMADESLMVCAPGAKPNPATNMLGDGYVSGKCSKCSADIHFSISAPTSIAKVCTKCGLKGDNMGGMAITEQTMDEVIEILGLPDTNEVREKLKQHFLQAITTEIERNNNDIKP